MAEDYMFIYLWKFKLLEGVRKIILIKHRVTWTENGTQQTL